MAMHGGAAMPYFPPGHATSRFIFVAASVVVVGQLCHQTHQDCEVVLNLLKFHVAMCRIGEMQVLLQSHQHCRRDARIDKAATAFPPA